METSKKFSVLSIITITASAIISLYYFIYLLLCLLGFDSPLMSFFALFVIAPVSLPIIFRKPLKKLLGRAFTAIQAVFTVIMCAYIITVAAFWCYIAIDSSKDPQFYDSIYAAENDTGKDTVIMVFGCRTYGYTPSQSLKLRLDTAYELLTALPDSICIVSGGQGSNETVPEAEAMQAYLIDRGIGEERIITESESHSTSENIRLTKTLTEKLGLTDKRIIGVSTDFHVPRIKIMSQRYGLPMEMCAADSPSFAHHYVSMIREYLSYIKMIFFDEAVIITEIT